VPQLDRAVVFPRPALDTRAAAATFAAAMSKLFLLIVGAALLCGLSACNTIGGAGQDISNVGQDIAGGARGVENAIRND
jgi:predicted small secreted protein